MIARKFPNFPAMLRPLAALSLAALLAAPAVARADAGGGWEYVTTDDGVVVYRKEIPGSDVVAFKGVTYANLPIGKLISVIKDGEQRKFWVDRYSEHKTIEQGADSELYWIHFALPWPISDRDYLLRGEGKADPERHVYTIHIKSVQDPRKGEDDCCVRAIVYNTFYEFTALPGENKTKIIVEVHTDPKGSLPTWLVNTIQKSWPAKTLNGLIRRVTEANPTPLPQFAGWHDKKPAPSTASAPPAEAQPKEAQPKDAAPPADDKNAQAQQEGAP